MIDIGSVEEGEMSEAEQVPAESNRLGWALVQGLILVALITVFLFFVNRHTTLPGQWGDAGGARNSPVDWVNVIASSAMSLLAAALGALVLSSRPRHPLGRLLLLSGAVLGLEMMLGEWLVFNYFTRGTPLPGSGVIALVRHVSWIPTFVILALAIVLFPDGRFLSARWGYVISLALATFAILATMTTMIETPLEGAFRIPHPFLAETPPFHEILTVLLAAIGLPFLLLSIALGFASLFIRFRRAGTVQRQQIKWLLAFVALMLLSVAGGFLIAFSGSQWSTVGELVAYLAFFLPLPGIGIAVLRYRLYDIDVVINRALVYGALSASLALVYFGSVVLLQRLLDPLVGRESDFAIVLSTLAIAALFSPLRRRVQRFIDRRFYRRRYDAQQVLAAFAASLRDRDNADLERLNGELMAVIQETMQPAHLSLWLRDPGAALKEEPS